MTGLGRVDIGSYSIPPGMVGLGTLNVSGFLDTVAKLEPTARSLHVRSVAFRLVAQQDRAAREGAVLQQS
ncbi:MAG: hypothetical protein QOE09_3066 [Ilumatobacteraceae bacterium]|jgi:hypothetical protein